MTKPRGFFSRETFVYCALLIGVVAVYLAIRAYGNTLRAPSPLVGQTFGNTLSQVHVNDFLHVLLALALVIASARILGSVFRWLQQPPVIGEMIAGIMLGPSLLGHFAPEFAAYILPQSIAPLLNVISQFGVILYMFLVGLELDLPSLKGQAHSTVMISHASIVVPFILGSSVSLLLYPHLSNSSVSFTAFSLFLGVSMSVTAFPVLARILTDRRIHKTSLGTLTLACAAIDDVTAWCLLAFVVSVAQPRSGGALNTIALALVYVAVMLLAIRPLLNRAIKWVDAKGRVTQGVLALILLAILFSSLTTEAIGIHAIFGAFVLGAIVPSKSFVAKDLTGKLEDFVIVFLLPAFFAFTGLRTQIGLVSGARDWMFCLLIILIASLGKFGGSSVAAKLNGLNWREASAVGILMNTRGLMELIVLNIGLELHVISPTLFAMLVIMALVTTFATTPILHLIIGRGSNVRQDSTPDKAGGMLPELQAKMSSSTGS
jgi:Kef-type K+ transport system membrane component KefB